ncbi:MAG TPA: glycosyltransferase family 39 protein, partial [Flavobacteriales bacterium]|nr:glycosyltransferase family 39 protein [Flavobacteriales bacterium]
MTGKRGFTVIFSAAVIVGIYRLWSLPPALEKGQTDNYWVIANNLLDGKGYSFCYDLYFPFCDGARPTAMREPIPTFLFAAAGAISGRSLMAALVVQLLAYLAALWLLHRWVRKRHGERIALIAAFFWAACLIAIQTVPQLSGDLVGTALFLGACVLFDEALETDRTKHWILTGVVLGLSALSRSVLLFSLLPWAWIVWRKLSGRSAVQRSRSIIVLTLATLITLSPWIIRNHNTFGRYYAGTSMNGYNLFRNAHPAAHDEPPHYVGEREARAILDDFLARHTELRGDENEGE